MPVIINNPYNIFELLLGTSVKEIVISLKLDICDSELFFLSERHFIMKKTLWI